MQKPAETQHAIHELLVRRWSPRAFSDRPVEEDKLLSLFEAARWAPSANNGQPWAFVVTTRSGEGCYQALVNTLRGRNPAWASRVPVLVLAVAGPYPHSDTVSRYSYYDLGQAVADLTTEATALGLQVHQMGGFDAGQARLIFELPEGYEPMTVIAIGYPGEPEDLPEDLRERELAARTRNPIERFVFRDHWNLPLSLPNSGWDAAKER